VCVRARVSKCGCLCVVCVCGRRKATAAPFGREVTDFVAGLALMTVCVYYCYGPYDSPYCSSGGSRSCSEDHVPILTRVLLSSNNAVMNAAAGVGCLGYGRVPEVGKPRSRSRDQA
jgi:hypothetical protein